MKHLAFLSKEAIEREKKTKKAEELLDIEYDYYIENKELIFTVDKDEKELKYDRFSTTITSCSTSSPGRAFYLGTDCAGGCHGIYDQRDR